MREFIIEADGGSRGNPGPAGYGAVVSDAATGETLAEAAEYLGATTNNVAEYSGLLAGLRAARELDPEATVHVRMDSKLVVEQMSGRWKIRHPAMKPLAAEAARVFPPGRVTYEWIPRERNEHADRLANEAMDAGQRGEPWNASASRAALDTPTARLATPEPPDSPEPPEPSGSLGEGGVRGADAAGGEERGAPAGKATADVRAASNTQGGRPAVVEPSGSLGEGGVRGADAAGGEERGAPAGKATADVRAASNTQGARPAAAGRSGPPGDAVTRAPRARAVPAPASASGPGAGVRGTGESEVGLAADAGTAPVGKTAADVRAAQAVAAPGTETDTARGTGPAPAATPSSGWAPADMGPPATFVLLRHGETPLTPQKRFSGSGGSDPSLSDVGREQAERTAAGLARRGTVQAIVASPLARARETAGVVAARLGLEVTVDDGLRETDFGAWEGLTFAEVRERHPDDLNAWLSSPDAEPTGGGESFAATATRIAAARDRLVAAYAGRTVLLVTHVTPIKTLVRLALGAPPEALFRMELSAASLTAVAYYADGNASVRLFNDTSHLR
ncbi:bifunctional RNase H/acid phosphatase [Streptomyces sp. NEAU-W12]|uniref:bifunctional RNase H/acid phosphatase n=1 Tax=Streptomyces sp. NEAU-W12 TaxID=2994668 RepID=UPI00224ACD58|nr:bifunctional RNase H/acid phosphatase [Streptomyces sp. NEAU-W12]MCX2923001.1 bifunctional RNase H/acid phosphatase [Streptomyces sp. NEAU-W12]